MRKLRIRFIMAAMGSLFIVLAAIVTGLNLISYNSLVSTADQAISKIIEGGGVFMDMRNNTDIKRPDNKPDITRDKDALSTPPAKPDGDDMETGFVGRGDGSYIFRNILKNNILSDETPYETRYFSIFVDDTGNVLYSHMSNIASVTEDEAAEYARKILSDNKTKGFIDDIYRYEVADISGKPIRVVGDAVSGGATEVLSDEDISGAERLIVIVDCRNKLITFYGTLVVSVVVSLVGWLVVFLLVVGTSKLVFKPVEISEMRQKQFLTDASHELKTPLAIIEANTEVMELETGETQWTKSTKNQVKRLSGLISQMVALTRIDESELGGQVQEFDYGKVVTESVEPYIAPAKLGNKNIITEIEEGIFLKTNEKNIRQLIGLLLDNSVKYSTENTDIIIKLKKHGRKSVLTVYNKTTGLPVGDNSVLFERFYRADASRNSQTGGSGIGLSVAKSITDRARGKITATSEDGESLLITVTI